MPTTTNQRPVEDWAPYLNRRDGIWSDRKKFLVLVAAAVAAWCLFLTPVAALAGQQCNDRDKVLKLLADKYSESPVAFGVTNNGGLVEVLKSTKSAEDDTWTIIVTTPQGVSCLVAAGEGWRGIEPLSLDPET